MMSDQHEELKEKMDTTHPSENGEEKQRQKEADNGGHKENGNLEAAEVKVEDSDGSGDDVSDEEDEDSFDESDGMGMTVKAWGEAGPDTVVLASEFNRVECGHDDGAEDDDDNSSYSEDDDDDIAEDDDDNSSYSEDDDDDIAEDDDDMFNDDFNNLYDAYQSVLATDSCDLDPLDTSVLEDPYADLPPICEDDELGSSEFSKSVGEGMVESTGFEDSNAQTVLPAFSKDMLGMQSSGGVVGTDELVSKKIVVCGSTEQEVCDSDGGETGGLVVSDMSERPVSPLEEVGAGAALKDTGDTVDSGQLSENVLGENQPDLTAPVEDVSVPKTSSGSQDTVAMDTVSKGKQQRVIETKDTIIVTATEEEVRVISKGGKGDCGDVVESGDEDTPYKDQVTGLMRQHAETGGESRDISPGDDTEVRDSSSMEDVAPSKNTAILGQDESFEASPQDENVEERHVEEASESLETVVTEAGDSVQDGEVAESQDEEAVGRVSADSQTEEYDTPAVNNDTAGPPTMIEDTDGEMDDSQQGLVSSPAECQDSQVEAIVDEEVEAMHDCQLQTEARYDSGCESEKSEQTSCASVAGGQGVQADGEHLAKAGHDGELMEDQTHSSKNYPDFISACEERLKVHYVSCYAKEAPIDWFHVPNKPTHRIFTNVNLMERNGRRHNQVLTFDLLNFKPGLRILIEGRAGMGKSTLIHRIAYDYGLGMLEPLQRFKLVFVLDVLKWSREQELHDVILEQAVQADVWGLEADDLFDWMQNNPDDVIFFIDGLDEHPGFPASHSLLSLAQGQLYPNSTVVFTTQPNRVFEITDCCQKFYVMQKFTEKQVQDFMDSFVEGKDSELDALKLDLLRERNVADFYKVPLHLALLCTLFQNGEIRETDPLPSTLTELFDRVFVYTLRQLVADRRVDTQKELELSMFEDMAFVLTRLALSCLQEDVVSLSKNQLAAEHEIDDDLLDAFIQYGLLEKVVCRDAYFFPYKLFQVFLAAKFIAIEYFSAANSGQIGVDQDMKHVRELFELCWSCYADGYKYEDLCIFTSRLLTHDYNQFVDALCKQYSQAPDDSAREMCLNVACACISENASNRGFISLVVDSLSPKGDLCLDISTDDASGAHLLGIAHMLAADKLPKLSLVNYNPSDTEALRCVAHALADTERLRALEIDFTILDPTINGMPKLKDGTEDFSLLKEFVKAISVNSSLRAMGLRLNVDMMSLQGVEVISGLFLNVLGDLKSLGVHVYFDNTSSYFQDCPIIKERITSYENLNLLISRFSVFLQNNSVLEKLELNGCFLHRDALPELKHHIINHQYLRAISLAGQKEGAPLHREGTNALAEILSQKNFDEVSLDLNSFLTHQPDKYSLKDNHVKYDMMQFENELIIARLLKAMRGNGKLKQVKLACRQIDCDLLDHVADFVEDCVSLTSLEIACEEMDDLFMLFLGCGILCSGMLESLTLRGKFDSGGATFLLVQSCVMSLSLKSVTLSGSFSQDCIDWLAVSLPNLNIQCTHPMTLTLQGQIDEGETDSVLESIEQLKDCVLPLDLLLETDFN